MSVYYETTAVVTAVDDRGNAVVKDARGAEHTLNGPGSISHLPNAVVGETVRVHVSISTRGKCFKSVLSFRDAK